MGFGSFFKSVMKPINEVTRFVGGVATLGQLDDPVLESTIGGGLFGGLMQTAGQAIDAADQSPPAPPGDSQSILTAEEDVKNAVKENEKRIRARMQTTFAGNLFESPIIMRKTLLGA